MLAMVAGCGRLSFERAMPIDSAVVDVTRCVGVSHDEDGDGVDDACDVCPQLGGDQLDSDGDGVGDACDIAATEQQRALFDPFTSARPDWMFDPRVTYQADSVGLPAVNMAIGIQLTDTPGRNVFEVGGRMLAGGTGSHQVAIHVGESATTNNYYCELFEAGNLNLMLTHTADGVNFDNIAVVPIGGAFDTGAYRLVMIHTPPDVTCIATWDGMRYETTGAAPATVPAEIMYIAAANIDTELDYFVRLITP